MKTLFTTPRCTTTTRRLTLRGLCKSAISTLGVALLLGGLTALPQAARADSYTLYLYESGNLVDVTYTYSAANGTVLDALGNPVSVALSFEEGHIYDLHGNLVGLIEYNI